MMDEQGLRSCVREEHALCVQLTTVAESLRRWVVNRWPTGQSKAKMATLEGEFQQHLDEMEKLLRHHHGTGNQEWIPWIETTRIANAATLSPRFIDDDDASHR